MVKVRFAPSPTGYIHLGNARIALINFLYAKKHGGKFLLRIDDTDSERSLDEYVQMLLLDLAFLKIEHDEFAKQSERNERYLEIKNKLIKAGRLYPCYESEEELNFKRMEQLKRGLPPVYDGSALNLTENEIKQNESEGKKSYWRFKLTNEKVSFNDLLKGKTEFYPKKSLSDPILIKHDGTFLYTFCSVIDDIDFEITHIIRGEDHMTNSAIQIQIFEAICEILNVKMNVFFAHVPLIFNKDGKPLSKRENSFAIKNLRENEFEGMAINSFLFSLSSSKKISATKNMNDLVKEFNLVDVNGAARIDEKEILNFNKKNLQRTPFSEIKNRLEKIDWMNEQIWEVIKMNISKFSDILIYENIFSENFILEKINFKDEELSVIKEASKNLENNIENDEEYYSFISNLEKKTLKKGAELYSPIRKAISNLTDGPNLKSLIKIIGSNEVKRRLENALKS